LQDHCPTNAAANFICSENIAEQQNRLTFLKAFADKIVSSAPRRTYMFSTILKLLRNEDGATAIEYGLIAALIAVAAVTVMGTVGTNLSSTFSTIAGKL